MKKIFIYIVAMVAMGLGASCSGYENDVVTVPPKNDPLPEPTPQDTTKQDTAKWASWDDRTLPVGDDMIARPAIYWLCTNGKRDSSFMEPWLLDIETVDLVVYRNEYQPSVCSGITPDAERTTSEEFKDKYNNLVKNHSYNQRYEFKNFTHSIYAAWRTGRIFYANGKEASYLPEDGIYFNMDYHVNDTVHFVRNDTIYAREDIDINHIITLKKTAKRQDWQSWTRKAKVTVISFVGLVEKKEEIPTAEYYANNLNWYAASGNRFYKKISENTKSGDVGYWEDGFLMSSDTHYILLIVHYTVDPKDGKSDEKYAGKEIIFVPKSEMITPTKGREYNAVMYDYTRGKYIPCRLSKDYNFSYGSQYADGSPVNFQPDTKGSVMDGVKNFTKDTARPTPWLETVCKNTPYNGKNYYTIMLKSSVHNSTTTVADDSLK